VRSKDADRGREDALLPRAGDRGGFTPALVELILDGLASADTERIAGGNAVDARFRITPAARRKLEPWSLAGNGGRRLMARAAYSGSSGCRNASLRRPAAGLHATRTRTC
jgi:hypothetical protein